MKITVNKGGKKISIEAEETGFFSRGLGLTFSSRNTANLLFEFNKDVRISITSVFVFFDFLAIWLDEKNRVLGSRIVRPFEIRIRPSKPFRKIVEVPVNDGNKKIVDFFVGKIRKV